MPTPREKAKDRSRRALIDAGLRLFREQGIDSPSLDAICAEAGYTRGAFYVHFADREAFLVAVMKDIGEPIVATLTGDGKGTESLSSFASRFLQAFADGSYPLSPAGGIRPHQLLAACARSPVLRDHYVALVTDAIDRLTRAIVADQARGTIRADVDAAALASGLLVLVVGGQSLAELGAPIDLGQSTVSLLGLLAPPPAQDE